MSGSAGWTITHTQQLCLPLPPHKGVLKWPQTDGYQHFPHAKWKVCEVETKYTRHLLPRIMKPYTSKPLCGPVRCSLWLCGELERCLPRGLYHPAAVLHFLGDPGPLCKPEEGLQDLSKDCPETLRDEGCAKHLQKDPWEKQRHGDPFGAL